MSECKHNAYNPEKIVEGLSPERVRPYLLFTLGTKESEAIVPYNTVQKLSSMLFTPLQYFEVTLRNRTYDVLTEHYRKRGRKYHDLGPAEDWLLWMPTHKESQKKIKKAYDDARQKRKGQPVAIGDVISGLSFGVWVDILKEYPSKASHRYFWDFTQTKLFPNAKGETRKTICRELMEIKNIRNRLFHYEPIWDLPKLLNCHMALLEIVKKYERVMNAIRWLSSDMCRFLREEGEEHLLAKRAHTFSDELKNSHQQIRAGKGLERRGKQRYNLGRKGTSRP